MRLKLFFFLMDFKYLSTLLVLASSFSPFPLLSPLYTTSSSPFPFLSPLSPLFLPFPPYLSPFPFLFPLSPFFLPSLPLLPPLSFPFFLPYPSPSFPTSLRLSLSLPSLSSPIAVLCLVCQEKRLDLTRGGERAG